MARIRSIKGEFFTDEEIAALPVAARLGFIGLWCHADREGRLEDRPQRLKVLIFPHDNVDFEAILAELASNCFIYRYRIDGKSFIQIRTFAKHQRPNRKEKPSEIPPYTRRKPGRKKNSPSMKKSSPSTERNTPSTVDNGEWIMENGVPLTSGQEAGQGNNGHSKTNGHSSETEQPGLFLGEKLERTEKELAKTKALVAELKASVAANVERAAEGQAKATNGKALVKELFDLGVKLMTKDGTSDSDARGVVGKLRSVHGDTEAMRLVMEAVNKTGPKAYLMATCRQKAYTPC